MSQPEFKVVKPARTPEDLLIKLRGRNLVSNDDDQKIIDTIKKIGYYRLSGYFRPLQNPKDNFREGKTFDDIIRLYEFDKKLRVITSHMLKVIEVELKAKLSDTMSIKHESDWYENKDLFMVDKVKLSIINECFCEEGQHIEKPVKIEISLYNSLIKDIRESIDRNKESEYIKDFHSKYGEDAIAPSWMMMECISFGKLSRLYALLKNSPEKNQIAYYFGASSPEVFSSWLHGFVVLRNACAHHSRIWNKRLYKDISFPNKIAFKFITETNQEGLKKFYGISGCILRILSRISQDNLFIKYKKMFNRLIIAHGIDKKALGFPPELAPYDIWND